MLTYFYPDLCWRTRSIHRKLTIKFLMLHSVTFVAIKLWYSNFSKWVEVHSQLKHRFQRFIPDPFNRTTIGRQNLFRTFILELVNYILQHFDIITWSKSKHSKAFIYQSNFRCTGFHLILLWVILRNLLSGIQ